MPCYKLLLFVSIERKAIYACGLFLALISEFCNNKFSQVAREKLATGNTLTYTLVSSAKYYNVFDCE